MGRSIGLQRLVGPLVGFAVVYFAFNSGLVATAIGIAQARLAVQDLARPFRVVVAQLFRRRPRFRRFWSSSIRPSRRLDIPRGRRPLAADSLHDISRVDGARGGRQSSHRRTEPTLSGNGPDVGRGDRRERSSNSRAHQSRAELRRELAVAVGIKNEIQLKAIQAAAVLHDTGKIAIPEAILNKPGPLTTEEFEVMKQHADHRC